MFSDLFWFCESLLGNCCQESKHRGHLILLHINPLSCMYMFNPKIFSPSGMHYHSMSLTRFIFVMQKNFKFPSSAVIKCCILTAFLGICEFYQKISFATIVFSLRVLAAYPSRAKDKKLKSNFVATIPHITTLDPFHDQVPVTQFRRSKSSGSQFGYAWI